MENLAAWIDDVFILTVKVPNIAEIMKGENPPVIYWEATDKYFPVKLGHAIDSTTVRMIFVDELPIGEDLFLNWGNDVYRSIHAQSFEQIGLNSVIPA